MDCISLPSDISRRVPFLFASEDNDYTHPIDGINRHLNPDIREQLIYVPLKDLYVPGFSFAGMLLVQHKNHRAL